MYFDKERLIRELIDNTNSMVEAVTLENFEDMSEEELRSLILVGSGRIRHAYRPETLYYQYTTRRGRNVRDPLDPSYELTQEDLEKVFNEMKKKFDGFEPETFQTYDEGKTFFKVEDEEPIRFNVSLRCEDGRPHSLLSQRNTYLDSLERDFNNMVNRQYVKDERPQEYDKGKGPGGFPMRNGSGNGGNYGMPAREPKFENHLIWLHDPDRRYSPEKKDTLAYDYTIIPQNKYVFSPGNGKPGQIQSDKMPDWMTTDPSRRDKVTFMDQITPKVTKTEDVYKPDYKIIEVQTYEEPTMGSDISKPGMFRDAPHDKKENRKLWLLIAFILFVFLLKKKR